MSNLNAKVLKKMIKEMIEQSDSGQFVLTDEEKTKILDAVKKLELNEANFVKRMAPYLAAAGMALGASNAKAAPTDQTSWQDQLGTDQRSWQDQLGTDQRPGAEQFAEKSYKYVVLKLQNNKTGKTVTLSFETNGRNIYQARFAVEAFLASKYEPGLFTVIEEKGSDTEVDDVSPSDSSASTSVKSASTPVVTNNGDGTYTGKVSFKGAPDTMKREKLESDIKTEVLKTLGKKTASLSHVGSSQIKMNPDGNGGILTLTVRVQAGLKENKITKSYLRSLIVEHLQECGMIEEVPPEQEAGAISIDPDGYEGFMAKGNLYKMAKSASELHNLFQDNENLEPWVQEKIAVAARMIDDVADYMEYAKMAKK